MLKRVKRIISKYFRCIIYRLLPELNCLSENKSQYLFSEINILDSEIGKNAKIAQSCFLKASAVGDYSYLAEGARIQNTIIGRFCSIGPNLMCGYGIHPLSGLSTSPMFYSTQKQNGMALSSVDKIQETLPITIGNDVFIGMNVTILDGVNIGDGAVIGAGAVVSKNIPPFAVAYGNPIQVYRYRFSEKQREDLLRIQWWKPDFGSLEDVENLFFDVDGFIHKHGRSII